MFTFPTFIVIVLDCGYFVLVMLICHQDRNVSMQKLGPRYPKEALYFNLFQLTLSGNFFAHHQGPSGNGCVKKCEGAFLHIPANVAIQSAKLRGDVGGSEWNYLIPVGDKF